MSGARLFAWRTWKAFGGILLDERFETPEEAGRWRAENYPGECESTLTLFAVVDSRVEKVTPLELARAHANWLGGNHREGVESRP